jgi:hypothetical protein
MLLENWLFGYQSLFHWGFWGMGLLFFFFPLSLVENALYTIFILFRGEQENQKRVLIIVTAVISIICTPIAHKLAEDGQSGPPNLLFLAITIFWSWYFLLVPQVILRAILRKIELKHPSTSPLRNVLGRLAFTIILPVALIIVHAFLGNIVFGITPD